MEALAKQNPRPGGFASMSSWISAPGTTPHLRKEAGLGPATMRWGRGRTWWRAAGSPSQATESSATRAIGDEGTANHPAGCAEVSRRRGPKL
jgi:hypothetical protein